jgi:hypothetical protein
MRLTIVWNEADARSRLTIAVNQCVNLTLIYIVFVRVAMNVNLKFVRVYFITIIYAGGHAPGGLGSVCPSCLPRQLVVGLAHRPHRRPVLPCLRPRSVAILRLTLPSSPLHHHHSPAFLIVIAHLLSSFSSRARKGASCTFLRSSSRLPSSASHGIYKRPKSALSRSAILSPRSFLLP